MAVSYKEGCCTGVIVREIRCVSRQSVAIGAVRLIIVSLMEVVAAVVGCYSVRVIDKEKEKE